MVLHYSWLLKDKHSLLSEQRKTDMYTNNQRHKGIFKMAQCAISPDIDQRTTEALKQEIQSVDRSQTLDLHFLAHTNLSKSGKLVTFHITVTKQQTKAI